MSEPNESQELNEYRGYDLSAKALGSELVAGRICVLTVGKSKKGRLFVLPLVAWKTEFVDEFGQAVFDGLRRIYTRTTTSGGLSEAVLLGVILEQVDAHGNMVGDSCAVVKLTGEDAAILVPANAFWRARVGAEEAE